MPGKKTTTLNGLMVKCELHFRKYSLIILYEGAEGLRVFDN
jgi:hypothetical protein